MIEAFFAKASSSKLIRAFLQITNFEVLDIGDYLTENFGIAEKDPPNILFETNGYESSDFIINIGEIVLFTFIAPVYVIIHLIASKIGCFDKLKAYSKK